MVEIDGFLGIIMNWPRVGAHLRPQQLCTDMLVKLLTECTETVRTIGANDFGSGIAFSRCQTDFAREKQRPQACDKPPVGQRVDT